MPPVGAPRRGRGRGAGPIGAGAAAPQWRRAAPVAEESVASLGEGEAAGREAEAEEAPEQRPQEAPQQPPAGPPPPSPSRPPEQPPPPRPPAQWPEPRPPAPEGQQPAEEGAAAEEGAEAEERVLEEGAGAEEDRGARARLARQLKVAEQQAAQRSAVVARLREDVRRLETEAGLALQSEGRLLGESKSLLLRSSSSEEAFRGQQSELMQKIRESEQRGAESRCKEREWREELDSMARQQGSLADEVADLERTVGRWRKAAAEQAERLACAERRLKNLEAQRTEMRSQGMHLQQLAGRHKETAVRERATVRELKGRIEAVEAGSCRQALVLQAAVVALWLLVLWLLLAERA